MAADARRLAVADGYRGIWYYCNGLDGELRYKYSGGLGTYCAKHVPLSCHAGGLGKTFFCYGGRPAEANRLLHMVGCYDHRSGMLCRPRILLDKGTDDAHDNATIMLDGEGHVWVFSSSHGTARPAYVSRSAEPYSIDAFERVLEENYSYPQAWHLAGAGWLFLHTRYVEGRRLLHWRTSETGLDWSAPQPLAAINNGHYQVSWRFGTKVGTAFNMHPRRGLDWRENLYYVETPDLGRTWRTVDGRPVDPPVTRADHFCRIYDSHAEGLRVYLKDLNFDAEGRPVILFVTSRGWEPGPANGPRRWMTACWSGREWEIRGQIESDSNYDTGCLHVRDDGSWVIVGPSQPGPQPYNPGGEMAAWASTDRGATWRMTRQLTRDSEYNHTYARRPVDAAGGFFAFWADGHGRRPSESRLYFCDDAGRAFRMPASMSAEWARPEPLG